MAKTELSPTVKAIIEPTAEADVEIASVETEIEPDAPRQWSYAETARYQLTGEYPEWYTP